MSKDMTRRPAHRPTAYRKEHNRVAHQLALLGATDEEMASALEVSRQTLFAWKRKHPDFARTLREGKLVADARVAESLFLKATGFTRPGVKHFHHAGTVVSHRYEEYYPPDTAAAVAWLTNRQPTLWRKNPDVAVTIGNANQMEPSEPPEMWSEAECEAYLRSQGVPVNGKPLPAPVAHLRESGHNGP